MSKPKSGENLRALVESSLLVAAGFVLSLIPVFQLPQGGTVTPLSMLPLLTIGLRHGLKWGISGGVVYSCLQMLQKFWPPPSGTIIAYIAVIFLDYVFAFTVLGLSGLFRGRRNAIIYAAPFCLSLRFICHFISGIAIWSVYAGDTQVWIYSLTYNGSFMGVELVITTIIGIALQKTAPMLFDIPDS